MSISIITVTYNCQELIEDTLRSVTSQVYPDIQYIIIDGNSEDNTIDIIEKYRANFPFIQLVSEADKGLYFAMNKGLSLAKGNIIGILNAGDFYTSPQALNKVANAFKKNPTDTLYSDLQYVKQGEGDKIIRHWESGHFDRAKIYMGWMPPHPTFFVKKEIYAQYGFFNTSLKISADYELMLRLLLKNKVSTQYLPGVLVKMPTGGTSNGSLTKHFRANMEDRQAWNINKLSPRIYTLTLKPLSKLQQFFRRKKI